MWVIAGVLLGIVVLAAILGFHTGPHSHALAGAAGVVAAAWLIVMALSGRSSSVLWTLFTADLLVSGGVVYLAWRALTARHSDEVASPVRRHALLGSDAVVVKELTPEGVVRVRGEQWTAVATNGPVPAGAKVHVMGIDGMRLEVFAEPAAGDRDVASPDVSSLFSLDQPQPEGTSEEASP